MTDWQPIETAPKDGSRVLGLTGFGVEIVRFGEEHFPEPVDGVHSIGWLEGWWGVEQDSECRPECHSAVRGVFEAKLQPTHWMPLPEPPA